MDTNCTNSTQTISKIRNDFTGGIVKLADVRFKMQERRLKWYGDVIRRDGNYVGRRVMGMDIPRHRRREWLECRWKDKLKVDMHKKHLLELQVWDRHEWQRLAWNSNPI